MSPAKIHGFLRCRCSFNVVFCKPIDPFLWNIDKEELPPKTPADPGLAGVFPALAVDKPVDNVDNSEVGKLEISRILKNYVNCYSVDNHSRFLRPRKDKFLFSAASLR